MTEHDYRWFVVYTRPRWEKRIAQNLEEKGIEAYCPLNCVQRQWSDRKKMVQEPLFKGYVFVRLAENKKWDIKQIDGILNFVFWNGKPAVVRDDEIVTIKQFLAEFPTVEVEERKLDVQQKVRIKQGLLMNYNGIVIEVFGNKARVLVESMGLQLSAIFEKRNLEPV